MMRAPRLGAALIFVCAAGFAQEAPAPKSLPPLETYRIARATSAVRADAHLDEQTWRDATVVPIEYEWFPGDNTAPPVRTECLMAFDDDNLYIAFRASDPDPRAIRAHMTDRDVPFSDDTVGIMLDTFNDDRRLFQFRVNPLGVQMDATNSDVDGSEDWSWDAIWASAGKITAEGYVVEIVMPFKSLRFANTTEQTWGFRAMRDYPRSNRHRLRSGPTDRTRDCLACQLEDLTGLTGIRPGLNAELDPTVTAQRTEAQNGFPDGPLEEQETKFDPGLTARWGITPNVSLNAAVNPDFSQVEADAAQLAVNERFALFFPEKRPFFLEGADFFSTPVQAVFTRTVANPLWGLKLTGKQERSAGGLFVSKDEINNLIFPSFEGSRLTTLDQNVLSSVARYRLDVGKTSTIGALITDREGDDYHNRVGGIDGNIRFFKGDSIRFQWLRSDTRYPSAIATKFGQQQGAFSGEARHLRYQHNGRDWSWGATYRTLDPTFRADSGFVARVDTQLLAGGITRTLYGKPGSWFTRMNFTVAHDRTDKIDGDASENGWDISADYSGPRQTYFSYNLAPNNEYFRGRNYNNLRHNLYFEILPSADFAVFVGATIGKTIDFTNAQQADMIRFDPTIEFSVARRINASLSHGFQRLDVAAGRLFDANLTQARVVYHLNLRTFVRAIVQYEQVERNLAAYTVPVTANTKELFTQLLFSYKVNPQTVFLAGYSDNALGLDAVGLTKTDRTVFVKVGYAWLF